MKVERRKDGRIVRTVTLADQRGHVETLTDDVVRKERKPRTTRGERLLSTQAEVAELKARMATAKRYVEPVFERPRHFAVDQQMVHGPNGWYMPNGGGVNQWHESLEND